MKTFASLLALAIGCGAPAVPPKEAAPASHTHYRLGDYVVYRYTGTFTAAPVIMREEIVQQLGERLTIDVRMTRGAEERHFQQVVTDTPENQANNVIDELYEIVGGERKKLANVKNEDVYRLYDWTIVVPDGRATNVKTSHVAQTLGGRAYDCSKTEGDNALKGRAIHFDSVECTEFLWTHVSSRFWPADGGDDVLRVEVADTGRK